MKNKKLVPNIRFKGFADDWKETTFGNNIISIQTGTNLLGSTKNEGIPILKMGNIQRGFFSLDKLEYLDINLEIEPENIAHFGDFFFNTRNTLDLVGKGATWMGEDGKFGFNSNIARFKFKGIDTVFYNYLYNTSNVIKQVRARAMGTTSVAAIYPENLNSIEYYLPITDEQKAIGNYFQNIDSLIVASEAKLAKLKSVKKACLEKMFPRTNSTTPELRFKGFTDEWKVSEMSVLAKFNPKSELPEEFVYVDLESVVGTEMVACREENKITAPSRAQRLATRGDLFYQTVRPYQKNNYLFDKDADNYVFSTGYAQLRPYGDGRFLLSLVQGDLFVKTVLDNCTGTSYPAINSADLSRITVSSPKFNEQKTIGNYFRDIDKLIALTEQKIEKLKNIKKACLDKMFVNV